MVFHIASFIHPWVSMCGAILFELVGTINAKLSNGLTVHKPTWNMFVAYILAVTFLALALDKTSPAGIDLGVAYATWSGLGTIVAALAGTCLYGEHLLVIQQWGIFITIVGLLIINLSPRFFRVHENVDPDGDPLVTETLSLLETKPLGVLTNHRSLQDYASITTINV